MTEDNFAQKLTAELETGLRQIDGVTLQRLADIRRQALACAHAADREWVMAQHGRSGQMTLSGGHDDGHHLPVFLRPLYFGIFMIMLLASIVLWQQFLADDDSNEQGFLDAQMLSGELPPSTYIHPDFKEWLSESRESR